MCIKTDCLAITHPELSKQWHPTKNGLLTPEDVSFGSDKKVWWKCYDGKCVDGSFADDHEWESTIGNRTLNNRGCPCCINQKAVSSNCLATTHPKIAAQWHASKNGSLRPEDITFGSNRKVWWQCHIAPDHEWEAPTKDRIKNHGCSCCAGKKVVLSNCVATTHRKIVREWHPTKNGTLTPNDVLAGSDKKVWWLGACGHEWIASLRERTRRRGTNCPKCKESKGERLIGEYLDKHNIQYVSQRRFKSCGTSSFDFAVKATTVVLIEYHGEQHYYPISFSFDKSDKAKNEFFLNYVKRDAKKERWCRDHNANLMIIPYWDSKRIPEILDDLFAGRQPSFSEPPAVVKKYEPMRQKILAST